MIPKPETASVNHVPNSRPGQVGNGSDIPRVRPRNNPNPRTGNILIPFLKPSRNFLRENNRRSEILRLNRRDNVRELAICRFNEHLREVFHFPGRVVLVTTVKVHVNRTSRSAKLQSGDVTEHLLNIWTALERHPDIFVGQLTCNARSGQGVSKSTRSANAQGELWGGFHPQKLSQPETLSRFRFKKYRPALLSEAGNKAPIFAAVHYYGLLRYHRKRFLSRKTPSVL